MSRVALPNDPPWLKRAFSDLGVADIAGPRHNARVLEMYRKAGHPEIHDDETAWCAAAVGCWLAESGLSNSGSLMARSYSNYGVKVNKQKLPRGTIAVWPRGAPPSGHVNIVLEDDGTYLTCIGGNQSPGTGTVSVSRERKAHLVSASWPREAWPPEAAPVAFVDAPRVDNDTDQPQQPDDPGVEPVEREAPWYRRAWSWVSGGGIGMIAGGIYDYRVPLAIGAILLLFTVGFVIFMGPSRVREWIAGKFR